MSKKTKLERPAFNLNLGNRPALSAVPAAKPDEHKEPETSTVAADNQTLPQTTEGGTLPTLDEFLGVTAEKPNEANTGSTSVVMSEDERKELQEFVAKNAKQTSIRFSQEQLILEEKIFRQSTFKSKQELRHGLYMAGLIDLGKQLGIIVTN